MLAHIILSLVCVFSSLFCSLSNVNSDGLKKVLYFNALLVFFFLALRYDFGNDYLGYYEMYNNIKDGGINSLGDRVEYGWGWLNVIFSGLSFYWMYAFIALFHVSSLVYLIEKYCPPSAYWLALFIYLCFPDNMLIGLSGIRQSIAMTFFLLSIDSILDKKYLRYFVFSMLGISFHSSMILIVIPVLLIIFFKKNNKIFYTFGCFSLFFLIVFNNYILSYMSEYFFNSFEKYQVYQEGDDAKFGSGLSLIFNLFFLISILYVIPTVKCLKKATILKIASLSYFFLPLGWGIGIFVRFIFYFEQLLVIAIPIVYLSLKSNYLKFLYLFVVIFYILYLYLNFFFMDIWVKKFFEYNTIIPLVLDYLF